MQVKTAQKISRSAVATVLATSSVALGLPAQSNAATFFSDVKPADFFYSAVNELAEKKIVNGYGDGTFRPFNNVTRGEAAKMLALSLKLDVANAETTQFSDVKKGDIFYRYIAALANKGIINGYPDGTFKPNEVVQRGAMAKMVALGYEFALATNITHPFKDVDQMNIFNQHIQTLVNLNITKGTSFNTFEPAKAVSRGELATFISRANKADAGKPIYVIDNVIGDKIYINSVGYTIGANVASYIKAENKSALIGGHIEGTFNGMTLTNVTKLTLNATGSANSIYTFDGGNSTYNGTLVVNGSYLKFKNWTLSGQTIISETPRKSLAQYNRFSYIKIASLASGLIDFTKPTNPDDGILNGGDNGGSLNPGKGTTPPYAPYNGKLTQIHKYVDFTNVIVRNLFVDQNRTYVAAQKEIAMVTIRRDVEFAELNFNMRNLYLEGDESLTLYGTHDIETVYKNSYYSVYFNSDSEINTLIVDNSNGWINLGDFVIIDKVIIPPKTTPNDIFDDYKNDNDKIGNIEDNTGGEVDRNPIENGVIPDLTPPILTLLKVQPESDRVRLTVQVNEVGRLHYLILPENAPEPTAREIARPSSVGQIGQGYKDIDEVDKVNDEEYVINFDVFELDPKTKYKIYLIHEDNANNFSGKVSKPFETVDGTPPRVNNLKLEPLPGGKRLNMSFNPTETGEYYYFYERGNQAASYSVEYIIDEAKKGTSGGIGQVETFTDGMTVSETIRNLNENTPYIVYVVMIDDSGNISTIEKAFGETSELDDVHPYVTGKDMPDRKLVPNIPTTGNVNMLNEFYIYFNEKLDKKTAENLDNYVLSGTGIVNIEGQTNIRPTQAIYSEHGQGSKVLLKIPSLTGFVHGDTLHVTVLPAVKDLAENEFTNAAVVPIGDPVYNTASYQHEDTTKPLIKDLKIARNPEGSIAEIEYTATKAGTIYYMIVPEDFDPSTIDPRDFVDEFGDKPSDKFDNANGKKYLEGINPTTNMPNLSKPKTAELGTQKFDYNYQLLNPYPFISYKLIMVLKDRSGNLSPYAEELIIADKEAPKIGSFNIESVRKTAISEADDTKAIISVESDEKGFAWYKVVEKYVFDSTKNKYVLNPLIYENATTYKALPGTTLGDNATREANFKREIGTTDRIDFSKGPLNTITLNGLTPHKEYVLVMGARDSYGNFTTVDKSGNLMYKEFYTDGTAPNIENKAIFRNYDDTFTITFSESIQRVYEDPNGTEKVTLAQKSSIMDKNLSDLMVITDSSGAVIADIDDKFVIESWSESSRKLKIKYKPQYAIPSDRTITVKMKSDVYDQEINNKPNTFDLNDFGKYIDRIATISFERLEIIPNTENKKAKAIFDLLGLHQNFEVGEIVNYYYLVQSGGEDETTIQGLTPKYVIDTVNSSLSPSLQKGHGNLSIELQRGLVPLDHTVGFSDDWVTIVIEDKYGNRFINYQRIGYLRSN